MYVKYKLLVLIGVKTKIDQAFFLWIKSQIVLLFSLNKAPLYPIL